MYSRIAAEDGFSYSSRSTDDGVRSDSIISQMQFMYERDGKVVVEFITDEIIHLTSLGTLKNDLENAKLEEIKDLIKKNITPSQV